MLRMPKSHWKRAAFVVCGALLGLAPLVYAESQPDEQQQPPTLRAPTRPGKNVRSDSERRSGKLALMANQFFLTCVLDRPNQVQRFALHCLATPHIEAKIADCCMAGDHWQVKVKTWDPRPNEAIASSPGGEGEYSMPARVFSYSHDWDMRAIVECSYLHGTSVFPIEADILVETGGSTCTVQQLGAFD
ncbi:hypothetical protein [Archangium sp.]|jgi:hypothetical protein|uniref:hypothetical protein n=1 Tax=Archangium sp. TaxID=1872627 RepID=UPI002ED87DBB